MATKRTPLKEATSRQIRAALLQGFNIKRQPNTLKADLIAEFTRLAGRDYLEELGDDDETPVPPVVGSSARGAETSAQEPKVTVIISRSEQEGVDNRVFLSVNGRAMLVERGVPSPIPRSFYEVLRNAEQTLYDDVTNPDGTHTLIPRIVPLYPHSVLSTAA